MVFERYFINKYRKSHESVTICFSVNKAPYLSPRLALNYDIKPWFRPFHLVGLLPKDPENIDFLDLGRLHAYTLQNSMIKPALSELSSSELDNSTVIPGVFTL